LQMPVLNLNLFKFWLSYFLDEKYNFLRANNLSHAKIIEQYELDLQEHIESLPLWEVANKKEEKEVLIIALKSSISHLKGEDVGIP
jgi:hypothetical protein